MRQQVRFLLAGAIAAAGNFGSRFLFNSWVSYELAVVLAFLVGLTLGFILMRGLVFHARDRPMGRQLGIFVVVNLLALLQTFVVSVSLAHWVLPAIGIVGRAGAIAHLVGVATPIVTSYFAHRFITFR